MLSVATFRTMNQFWQQNKSYSSSKLLLLCHGIWRVICSLIMPLVENNQRILIATKNVGQFDVLGWICLPCLISRFTTTFVHLKFSSICSICFIVSFIVLGVIVSYLLEIIIFHTIPYVLCVFIATFIIIACIGVLLEDKFFEAPYNPKFFISICILLTYFGVDFSSTKSDLLSYVKRKNSFVCHTF